MGTPSAEALLISALLNNHDVAEASKFGITPDKLRGYREEYMWCLTYLEQYREQPSKEAFEHAFPDFPLRNHYDTRWAADEVLRSFFTSELTQAVSDAIDMMKTGNVSGAYARVRERDYQLSSAVPVNLVTDMSFFDETTTPPAFTLPWATPQGATGGIRPGNYTVFASRLGQGKTSYVLSASCHALMDAKRILLYSLEMSEPEIRCRLHAFLARKLGYSQFTALGIRDKTVDQRDYKEFVQELGDRIPGEIHVHTPALGPVSPATIASRADEYDLVVVDYATLMATDDGSPVSDDWRSATQVSNRIKQIGLASNTAMLVAAQINREGDTAGWRPPKVKNLAQADAFGQDADLVITFKAYSKTTTVFSVEKNRHGPSGQLYWTRFDPNRGIFDEIPRSIADDIQLQEEDESE